MNYSILPSIQRTFHITLQFQYTTKIIISTRNTKKIQVLKTFERVDKKS